MLWSNCSQSLARLAAAVLSVCFIALTAQTASAHERHRDDVAAPVKHEATKSGFIGFKIVNGYRQGINTKKERMPVIHESIRVNYKHTDNRVNSEFHGEKNRDDCCNECQNVFVETPVATNNKHEKQRLIITPYFESFLPKPEIGKIRTGLETSSDPPSLLQSTLRFRILLI